MCVPGLSLATVDKDPFRNMHGDTHGTLLQRGSYYCSQFPLACTILPLIAAFQSGFLKSRCVMITGGTPCSVLIMLQRMARFIAGIADELEC